MNSSFNREALRMAASVLVSDSVPPASESERVPLDHLLQGRGQVVGHRLRRWVEVESPSPEDAALCRTALQMISGIAGFPPMWALPRSATRTLVYCSSRSVWGWRVLSMLILHVGALLVYLYLPFGREAVIWVLVAMAVVFSLAGYLAQQSHSRRFDAVLAEGRSLLAEEKANVEQESAETERHSQTWTLVREAERAFRNTTNKAVIYPLLAHQLRRLIPGCDNLLLWRLDETEQYLEVQYAEGRYAEQLMRMGPLERTAGVHGVVLETGQPHLIPDLVLEQHLLPQLGGELSGSALVLPIFTPEGNIGSGMVTCQTRGAFADDQVWGAELLTGLAGLRIHALLVRDREQRLVEEFARLSESITPAWATPSTGDPMEQVGASIAAASQADGAIVYRMTHEHELVPCSVHGLRPETADQLMLLPAAKTPASLPIALGVLSDLSRRDLGIWPEFRRFFDAVEAERCLVLPIQRADGQPMASVVLVYRAGREGMLTPERLALCDTYARYAGATVHNLELYATVMRQSGELRELLGRVVDAQERERGRIALDLHDWLVQGLAAPSFAIQAAERLLDRAPEAARMELKVALQQLNQASDEMRRIMKGLRPHLLDDLGLPEAIKAYAQEFSEGHGVLCRVINQAKTGPARGSQEALVAFRIIQEALNNVAKHAGASVAEVTLRSRENLLEIMVHDDGCGFDVRQSPQSGHFGLLGMQERAAAVGGRVRVSSLPGQGTQVQIQIPLPKGT